MESYYLNIKAPISAKRPILKVLEQYHSVFVNELNVCAAVSTDSKHKGYLSMDALCADEKLIKHLINTNFAVAGDVWTIIKCSDGEIYSTNDNQDNIAKKCKQKWELMASTFRSNQH